MSKYEFTTRKTMSQFELSSAQSFIYYIKYSKYLSFELALKRTMKNENNFICLLDKNRLIIFLSQL